MSERALRFERVGKRYGARAVLADVSLEVAPGGVHALLGENGAGKSTLIKCAAGLVPVDEGAVRIDGVALERGATARDATARGVGVVHQHFMLVDTLTVAENVVLGHEPGHGPLGLLLDRSRARSLVRELGERYGLRVDPDVRVEALSVGERQRVELLKVLARGAKYVLFDEPTAVLSPTEVPALLALVKSLAGGGAGVLFVSHKLDEVFAVSDTLTVLRRGRVALQGAASEFSAEAVSRALVGHEAHDGEANEVVAVKGDASVGLRVRSLEGAGLHGVSLEVRCGEVLGVAGVEGNGQRALVRAIAGLEPSVRGSVLIAGVECSSASVRARREAGLGFVPEDREGAGLCADLSVEENIALGVPQGRWPDEATRRARARSLIERFDIRPADPQVSVRSLSGGNAQKVLIARELDRTLRALVVAQPTRGVDLGAAARIRAAIRETAAQGAAVLLVSSELDELRALCARVLVLRAGRIAGELPIESANDEALGRLMTGVRAPGDEART